MSENDDETTAGDQGKLLPIPFYDSAQMARDRFGAGMRGVRVAEEIARNRKNQAAARVGAARLLMEFAGFLAIGRAAANQSAKEPATMTTAELKALVSRLDGEIAGRATVIGPTEQDDTQETVDIVG